MYELVDFDSTLIPYSLCPHSHSLSLSLSFQCPHSINGDHIPDLFATTCDSKEVSHNHNIIPTFFISNVSDNSFKFTTLPLQPSPVADITNSYFVDLDSDCLPELVLYREANRSMEVWRRRENEGFIMVSDHYLLHSIFSRDSMKVVGLPAFADMGKHLHTYMIGDHYQLCGTILCVDPLPI